MKYDKLLKSHVLFNKSHYHRFMLCTNVSREIHWTHNTRFIYIDLGDSRIKTNVNMQNLETIKIYIWYMIYVYIVRVIRYIGFDYNSFVPFSKKRSKSIVEIRNKYYTNRVKTCRIYQERVSLFRRIQKSDPSHAARIWFIKLFTHTYIVKWIK